MSKAGRAQQTDCACTMATSDPFVRCQDGFLYETLATQISHQIERNTLRPGVQLPSVRRLSRERGLSVSTVLQAYRLLEDRGLVEARPQSGYYVRAVARRRPSEPAKTSPPLACRAVEVSGLIREVFETLTEPGAAPFGAALPAPSLLPIQQVGRYLARVGRDPGHAWAAYAPRGDGLLRQVIARRSLLSGCSLTADDLIVTTGCMEAVSLCLRAVARPGDTIAVESPTYFGFFHLIERLGMRVLELPTHPETGLCLDDVAYALRRQPVRALLLTPNFNNPLGSLMPDEKKARLVELLAAYDLPLIEDDLYGDLYFGGVRPKPVKAFDTEGRVLYCNSFSKTIAPGYRVGYAAPGRYYDAVLDLKLAGTIASALPMQQAIAAYLQSGGYERHLGKLRRIFRDNVARVLQGIAETFPEGTRASNPQGGFLLWVELPGAIDAVTLYRAATAEGVGLAPGPLFSAGDTYSRFVRLSCGYPWSAEVEGQLRRLGRLVHGHIDGA